MKTIGLLLGAVLVVYASYRLYRDVALSAGLENALQNGAILLDVRTPKEYEVGHIAGSVNVSLGSLREKFKELDSAKTYITYCSHGLRSAKAESILKERGFLHVLNGGAMTDLQKEKDALKTSK